MKKISTQYFGLSVVAIIIIIIGYFAFNYFHYKTERDYIQKSHAIIQDFLLTPNKKPNQFLTTEQNKQQLQDTKAKIESLKNELKALPQPKDEKKFKSLKDAQYGTLDALEKLGDYSYEGFERGLNPNTDAATKQKFIEGGNTLAENINLQLKALRQNEEQLAREFNADVKWPDQLEFGRI
jgi:hypothetical protein